MTSSKNKGDKLKDIFFEYLNDQKARGELVYGAYTADNCKIHKKKKYFCKEREAKVEFDIVIEVYQLGRKDPHFYVIFECKNHISNIKESHVTDFSHKIGRMFKHCVKGIIVITSQMQSGAEKIAKNYGMGIAKFSEYGLEIVADREDRRIGYTFARRQMFHDRRAVHPLKFSAYLDDNYFGSVDDFLNSIFSDKEKNHQPKNENRPLSIPFLSIKEIREAASELLELSNYASGQVNILNICEKMSASIEYKDQKCLNSDGKRILGSADLSRKTIKIYPHPNSKRERFTIAHELGHIQLDHGRFLRSEAIIERDLITQDDVSDNFNFDRLEYQADLFASELILPHTQFLEVTHRTRQVLGIRDRGHGYIFVDDQPCNFTMYAELLSRLSEHFNVSKQVIQIKLKNENMLTDQREQIHLQPISSFIHFTKT